MSEPPKLECATRLTIRMIRILVTNDDGIHSDGLIKLEEALKQIGDVYVVAPASEMSGARRARLTGGG